MLIFWSAKGKTRANSSYWRNAENRCGFGGFATHLDLSFSEPDMFALPDPDSLIQLPWQPDVGWLASDLVMNNKFMDQCPRVILKNQIKI